MRVCSGPKPVLLMGRRHSLATNPSIIGPSRQEGSAIRECSHAAPKILPARLAGSAPPPTGLFLRRLAPISVILRSAVQAAALGVFAGFVALPAARADEQIPPVKPAISDQAATAVSQMGNTLLARDLTITARTISVYLDEFGQPLHIFHTMKIAVHRPDQIAVEFTGDDGNHNLFYDGKAASVFFPDSKQYLMIPASGDIPSALDEVTNKLDLDFPLSALFCSFSGPNPVGRCHGRVAGRDGYRRRGRVPAFVFLPEIRRRPGIVGREEQCGDATSPDRHPPLAPRSAEFHRGIHELEDPALSLRLRICLSTSCRCKRDRAHSHSRVGNGREQVMTLLKRTFIAFLGITAVASDVAFGQFAPPPGGLPSLPMGGPPHLPAGGLPRPQMGGVPRPPVASHGRPPMNRPTHAPNFGGAKGRLADGPGRGGSNLSGNIRNTVNSGGNINQNRAFMNSGGNIAVKGSGNVTVNNSGDFKVSGNGNGYFGRGYYGRGDRGLGGYGGRDYGGGDYGRGYYRRGAYILGGYAVGVATGAAAASSTSGTTYSSHGEQSGTAMGSSGAASSGSSHAASSRSSGGTYASSAGAASSSSAPATSSGPSGGSYPGSSNQSGSGPVAGGGDGGSNQGGNSGSPSVNPLIVGLFESLPADGTAWTSEGAVGWLQAAAANLRIAYKIQGNILVTSETPPSNYGNRVPGGN